MTIFFLLNGIASLITCQAAGLLSDMKGRKWPLMVLATGGCVYSLGLLLFESNAVVIAVTSIGSLTGGLYSAVSAVFASLADLLEDQDSVTKTKVLPPLAPLLPAPDVLAQRPAHRTAPLAHALFLPSCACARWPLTSLRMVLLSRA